MKHYFASYWCIKKDGSAEAGQVIYQARAINVLLTEIAIKKMKGLERVTLLSVVRLTRKEYERNKRLECMALEGEDE